MSKFNSENLRVIYKDILRSAVPGKIKEYANYICRHINHTTPSQRAVIEKELEAQINELKEMCYSTKHITQQCIALRDLFHHLSNFITNKQTPEEQACMYFKSLLLVPDDMHTYERYVLIIKPRLQSGNHLFKDMVQNHIHQLVEHKTDSNKDLCLRLTAHVSQQRKKRNCSSNLYKKLKLSGLT